MIREVWRQTTFVGGIFAVFGTAGFFGGKAANSASQEDLIEARRQVAVAEVEYIGEPGCYGATLRAMLDHDTHEFALNVNTTYFMLSHTCGPTPDPYVRAEEAVADYTTVQHARQEVDQIEMDMDYTRDEAVLYTLMGGFGGPIALMGVGIALGNDRIR